jgi:allophanate hydrolase
VCFSGVSYGIQESIHMTRACKALFSGATLSDWQDGYRDGSLLPNSLLETFGPDADDAGGNDPAWITRLNEARLNLQLRDLAVWLKATNGDTGKFPLYGIPFAVKDNIDVAGWPTTAACPRFSYVAREDAVVVHRLRQAGAIVIGKTNLDQFATGLAGVRSPYGVVPNTFRPEYICGGSSSGSASVVARGVVPFALGTDTAGSGRVPAGMNNIVGLKPTRGWLPATGVVPACRTLDCVSVLALTVEDAELVANIAGGFDSTDAYSRLPSTSAPAALPERPRFGVPQEPEFFGDLKATAAYERALEMARRLGAELVRIDFSPFLELSALLYESSWVAERFVTLEPLLRCDPDSVHPTVRAVVGQAANFSAADTFRAEYQRARLAGLIAKAMNDLDGLLVPTAPTVFTIDEVLADPIALNAKLGIYSSFANFADLCALALPAGMRADGLPAGITLLAPAWHDRALADFGLRWQRGLSASTIHTTLGATGRRYRAPRHGSRLAPANAIRIAVVGAHLEGMPLNHQLTSRGAAFVETTATADEYRLFALADSAPLKPGLVRAAAGEHGASIEIELWDLPTALFGSFAAEIPPPLAIGNVILRDGQIVKGFICEQYGLTDAREITSFGGWRAYLASLPRHP